MKFKLGELKFVLERLGEILVVEKDGKAVPQKMPVKTSYWINKAVGKIEREYRDFEQERIKLLKRYWQLDENGQPKTNENGYDLGENQEAFGKELIPLLNEETEEIQYPSFPVEAFGNAELAPQDVAFLIHYKFMKGEEKDEPGEPAEEKTE